MFPSGPCLLSCAPHASVTSASILFLQSCSLHKTGLSGHSCYYFLAYTQLSELYFAHVSREFQINLNKHEDHVQVTVWINRTSLGLSKSVELIRKLRNTESVKFSVLLFTVCSGEKRITYCAPACSLSRETSPEIWKLGETEAVSEKAFVSRPFDTLSTRKERIEQGKLKRLIYGGERVGWRRCALQSLSLRSERISDNERCKRS